MVMIPKNYPHGCSDAQIRVVMAETAQELAAKGYNINLVLPLGPLITIGQAELDRRNMERLVGEVATLKEITETATTAAATVSRRSLRLGWAGVLVAACSVLVTVLR